MTLFEKSNDVGGVWQKNYAGYALQVRAWHYSIPGYDWPKSTLKTNPKYPTGAQVQEYIKSYAKDAGLLPLIRFNVDVKQLNPLGDAGSDGWNVSWSDVSGKSHEEKFDYTIVATGLFNEPIHPGWADGLVQSSPRQHKLQKGDDIDDVWIVDAKDFTDASTAAGKHVAVVGGGKTAHDVAVNVGDVAASSHLIVRRGHWMAPQLVFGFLPLEFATYTRWSWALQPAYYSSGGVKKTFHTIFSPVKAAAWGVFGFLFPFHTGTPSKLVPKHGLLKGIYDTIGMVDAPKVRKAFKKKKVVGHLAEIEQVNTHDRSILLSDGSKVEADIIVLATGYRSTASSLFSPDVQVKAGFDGDGEQWLYRNVLPASNLQNIAFIGLNATFQHVLTTALQSRWLVDVLQGKIKVPSEEDRLKDIEAQKKWIKKLKFPSNATWALHGKYHDVLVKDIRGYTNAYHRLNFVGETFGYIHNQLYASLFPGNKALVKSFSS